MIIRRTQSWIITYFGRVDPLVKLDVLTFNQGRVLPLDCHHFYGEVVSRSTRRHYLVVFPFQYHDIRFTRKSGPVIEDCELTPVTSIL